MGDCQILNKAKAYNLVVYVAILNIWLSVSLSMPMYEARVLFCMICTRDFLPEYSFARFRPKSSGVFFCMVYLSHIPEYSFAWFVPGPSARVFFCMVRTNLLQNIFICCRYI